MPGSKTNAMSRKETLAAVRGTPPAQDFVWDGVDADDRPATAEVGPDQPAGGVVAVAHGVGSGRRCEEEGGHRQACERR